MTRGKATHNRYDSRALKSCQREGRKEKEICFQVHFKASIITHGW